jgi:hypothetical protein
MNAGWFPTPTSSPFCSRSSWCSTLRHKWTSPLIVLDDLYLRKWHDFAVAKRNLRVGRIGYAHLLERHLDRQRQPSDLALQPA